MASRTFSIYPLDDDLAMARLVSAGLPVAAIRKLGAALGLRPVWSAETLDEFLANPNAKVPGTAMIGILTDPQQRADVIAYLSTLKD